MKKEFESSLGYTPPVVKPGQKFFIIWNPEGKTPPSVKFTNREDAQKSAEGMARSFRGQEFFVMEARSLSVVDGVKTTELE